MKGGGSPHQQAHHTGPFSEAAQSCCGCSPQRHGAPAAQSPNPRASHVPPTPTRCREEDMPHIKSRSRQELHTTLRNYLVKKQQFLLLYRLLYFKAYTCLAHSFDFLTLGPLPNKEPPDHSSKTHQSDDLGGGTTAAALHGEKLPSMQMIKNILSTSTVHFNTHKLHKTK